ncbi:MAG: glycerol kinase GlpK [Deltaproteobacteria bacterium]|nr:glycerol kinase GlpK [Deltaproteobacteria bacterium]
MSKFVLALDQGTTATTAMVVGGDLSVLGKASNEIPQIYPRPGWVEHDPEAIWATTGLSARQAMEAAGVDGADCAALGITNQRETTVIWDRDSGRPRYNGIVWQCRRTAELCSRLKEDGLEPLFRERTGLVLDPYFSGTKVRWLLDNVEGLRGDAEAGRVCFGTVDSFLMFRLTGGASHVTDVTNASRTLLFNLRTLRFDADLLEALDVPSAILPEVKPSAGVFGTTRGLDFLPDGIPVSGVAGDQQAALFGQTCFQPGQSKCTYGTGAFLLLNTGSKPVPSNHGLLTTVAWTAQGETSYALEGSCFIAGAAVQWLRDEMGLIENAPDVEALARSVTDSGGVVFVPALAGLGAPHWKPDARGGLFGLARSSNAAHVARAVLDGVALQITDLAQSMANDVGEPLTELRVDGGASANDLLMQFQSDVLGLPVVRPRNLDTTAMGAASLAGLGVELWDRGRLTEMAAIDRRFEPGMAPDRREETLTVFRRAVELVGLMSRANASN